MFNLPRKAKLEVVRAALEPVLKDPGQAGEVHWTAVNCTVIYRKKLSMELGYRTAVRWLHELDYHLHVPRLWLE